MQGGKNLHRFLVWTLRNQINLDRSGAAASFACVTQWLTGDVFLEICKPCRLVLIIFWYILFFATFFSWLIELQRIFINKKRLCFGMFSNLFPQYVWSQFIRKQRWFQRPFFWRSALWRVPQCGQEGSQWLCGPVVPFPAFRREHVHMKTREFQKGFCPVLATFRYI